MPERRLRSIRSWLPPYNTRGHIYYAKRDYDRAIRDYDGAIRRDPRFAMYYVNRAVVHDAKGEIDLAIRDADAAIGIMCASV